MNRNPLNPWLRAAPLTDDELKKERARRVEWLDEHFEMKVGKFTCDDCSMVRDCTLAFDGYNTDGDCLYDK